MFRTASSIITIKDIFPLISGSNFSVNFSRNASSLRTYCFSISVKFAIFPNFKQSLLRKFCSSPCIHISASTAIRKDTFQSGNSISIDSIDRISLSSRNQYLDISIAPQEFTLNKKHQLNEEDAKKIINSFSSEQKNALLTIQREFELLRV